MHELTFEITRRCNLNCGFCCKGDAQNVDMPKSIIDKTLNELGNGYFNNIRINGGEPFLAPELITYIIDQIIARKVKMRHLVIISNATIINSEIRDALNRCDSYIKDNYKNYIEIDEINNPDKIISNYVEDTGEIGTSLILSSFEHNNQSTFKDVYNYYSGQISILRQVDYANQIDEGRDYNDHPSYLMLEGKAVNNWHKYINAKNKLYRKINNKYNIVYDKDPTIYKVLKSLTVSVYGNVFVGCSLPYNREDAESICNIKDCNNDFFEKVDLWAWQYPISYAHNEIIEKWMASHWLKEQGQQVDTHEIDILKLIVDYLLMEGCYYHKMLPYLNHLEILDYVRYTYYTRLYNNVKAHNHPVNLMLEIYRQLGYGKVAIDDVNKTYHYAIGIINLLETLNVVRSNTEYKARPYKGVINR